MGRLQYESDGDLANETAVASYVGARWNCNFEKLPISYHLDFALTREGAVEGFAEIKCRTSERTRYPTYMIALSKLNAAMTLRHVTGLPVFLIVRWRGGEIGYCDLLDVIMDSLTVEMGGRKDRGDWQDVEPVAHIDIGKFLKLA